MADIPNPAPAAKSAVKGLTGNKKVLYGAIALGVIVAVYMMRRNSTPSAVPTSDPNIATDIPDNSIGRFQGYDTPTDTNITGPDLLDFILQVREQNIALTPIPDPAPVPIGGVTGGGLSTQEIPNPAAPQVRQNPTQPAGQAQRPKPCCLWKGRPLSYWQQNKGPNGKWGWPDGKGYSHTKPFRGNKPCDGGGVAGRSHTSC